MKLTLSAPLSTTDEGVSSWSSGASIGDVTFVAANDPRRASKFIELGDPSDAEERELVRQRGAADAHDGREGAGAVQGEPYGPFQRGRGGPAGWWILPEPGVEFPSSPEVSPDVAGWKRERMAAMPRKQPITVVPYWVCEVISDSTRRYDLRTKRPFYAREGVSWLWVVDPDAWLLTAYRNDNGQWAETGVWTDEKTARIPPFGDVEIDVSEWWLSEEEADASK